MRYGREKAIVGPNDDAALRSSFFGVVVGPASFGCRNGDFSTVGVDAAFGVARSPGADMTGSGNDGMESSADEVSIVMFLVLRTPSLTV